MAHSIDNEGGGFNRKQCPVIAHPQAVVWESLPQVLDVARQAVLQGEQLARNAVPFMHWQRIKVFLRARCEVVRWV
jgi:hypothetical protein